jgi:hypothetical protein
MWTRIWFMDMGERVCRTAAQTFLAVYVPTGLAPATDWKAALIASGTAAVLSLLMSLAATGVGDPSSASLIRGVRSVGRHELRK